MASRYQWNPNWGEERGKRESSYERETGNKFVMVLGPSFKKYKTHAVNEHIMYSYLVSQ